MAKILNLTNEGVAAAHGWVNNEGVGDRQPNKEAGNHRAGTGGEGPSATQKPRPLNIQPHRQRLHDVEKLNCSLEAYGHRNHQIVRGFTSREHEGWINPLTKARERGREKLIKR